MGGGGGSEGGGDGGGLGGSREEWGGCSIWDKVSSQYICS